MPRRITAPRRLRRRLTVAFVLVAAVSAGALAGGSYLAIRNARLGDSANHAVDQVELHARSLEQVLPRRPSPAFVRSAIGAFGGGSTVAAVGDVPVPSLSLSIDRVPADLQRLVRRGELAFERTSV